MKRLFVINIWMILVTWLLYLNSIRLYPLVLASLILMNLSVLGFKKRMCIPLFSAFLFFGFGDYAIFFEILLAFEFAYLNEIVIKKKPSDWMSWMVVVVTMTFYLCALIFGFLFESYRIYWLMTISHIFLPICWVCLVNHKSNLAYPIHL